MSDAEPLAVVAQPNQTTQASCVAELIGALSHYLGRSYSVESLRHGIALTQGVVLFEQLPGIADRADLAYFYHESPLKALDFLKLPALLELEQQQACVLLEKHKNEWILLTASGGKIAVDPQQVEQAYTGRCFTLQPNIDREAKRNSDNPAGHWLWSLIWSQKKSYFEAATGSIIINILGLALPLFIMAVYDRIIPNYAMESLSVLVIGMMMVAVIDLTLRQLRAYTLDRAGRAIDTYLGNRIFNHVLNMRLQKHTSSGATANTVRELDLLREFLNSTTLSLISDVPFLFLFLFAIYLIGGPLVWVPIIVIPSLLLFFLLTQIPLYRLTKAAYLNASNRNSVLFEMLNGIESIKALGAESWASQRWEKAHATGVKTSFESKFYSLMNQNVMMFAQTISMVAIITFGVFLVSEGELSFGALFAAVIINGRIMAPISQIAQIIGRLHAVVIAYAELNKLMTAPVEYQSDLTSYEAPKIEGNLVFDDVSFAYEVIGSAQEAKIDVLKNISCSIAAGEKVAIVGAIGSGKSTLLKLMLNIISPETGTLRLEGIDSREIKPADLRTQIGYMPQNLQFFSGSIRDNIALHRPQEKERAINRAAALAGINDWLGSCPLGLSQPVGERGDYLSGGQRQSLGLARTLIGNPNLILMDEPTSLLDSQSESKFVANLNQVLPGKTLIITTHRPAMLSLVDRIIVLDKGRIAMDGPKQNVLNALAGNQ